LNWPKEKLAEYRKNLERLKEIASRYAKSTAPAEREMARIAGDVVRRWGERTP
jgi:hypothetical protein